MTVSLPPSPELPRAEAPPWEPASVAARVRTAPTSLIADTWLEADGRGGYACLRHDGSHPQRPGEGLLVVPYGPRREQHVLVSSLDERVAITARAAHIDLGVDAPCVGPALAPTCTGFEAASHPAWTFSLSAAGVVLLTLRREVLQPRGRHATLVRWTLLDGDAATLVLRPRLPFRPAHARTRLDRRVTPGAVVVGGAVLVRPYPGLPALRFNADNGLDFRAAPRWVGDSTDASEDQFSPGELHITLTRGVPFTLELALSYAASPSPEAAFRRELARRLLVTRADHAAERFLAHTTEGRATVLSGWPADDVDTSQGAQVFSALPGLTFARGAHDLGLQVLVDALPFLDAGLMPERFGVDAYASRYGAEAPGLWFAWAVRRALAAVPTGHSRLREAVRLIAERFCDGLGLVDHVADAPGEARLVELALGADLAGHCALAGGRQARRWARVRRHASQLVRAQLTTTNPLRPRLIAAMLEHSPLDRATRRALVAEVAQQLETQQLETQQLETQQLETQQLDIGTPPSFDSDELAWFTEAALRIAPATRPRLAALAAPWGTHAVPRVNHGAADVGAWLATRAALLEAPR